MSVKLGLDYTLLLLNLIKQKALDKYSRCDIIEEKLGIGRLRLDDNLKKERIKDKPKKESAKDKPSELRNQSESGFKKTGLIIIAVSMVIMLVALYFEAMTFPTDIEWLNELWNVGYILIVNVSAVVITIGCGTVLYGYFDFIKYVKDTLCGVIMEYKFVDNLSDHEKEKLIRYTEKQIIYKDCSEGNNTLYDFVNREIINLVKGPYYETLSLNFNCTLVGDTIVKHVFRNMLINVQHAPDYKFSLERITRCLFNGDPEEVYEANPYELKSLIINGKELIDCTERYIQSIEEVHDILDYHSLVRYRFKDSFDESDANPLNGIIDVRLEYVTRVHVSDKTLGFRTYFPCKQMDLTFVYDNSLSVTKDIFCFKDRKNDGSSDRDRIQVIENDNSICIKFLNWVLPGDGIIYYIETKT